MTWGSATPAPIRTGRAHRRPASRHPGDGATGGSRSPFHRRARAKPLHAQPLRIDDRALRLAGGIARRRVDGGAEKDPLIERSRPTLPAFLKSQGYATGMVGKWHLGLGYRANRRHPGRWLERRRPAPADARRPARPRVRLFPRVLAVPRNLGSGRSNRQRVRPASRPRLDPRPHRRGRNRQRLGTGRLLPTRPDRPKTLRRGGRLRR